MGEIDVPTVLMGSQVSDTPFDLVSLDDVKAGRLAAKRLIDLGHRRIAVIGGREGVSSHEERLRGCRLEFAERNLELDDETVVLAHFRADRAYEGTLRLLGAKPRPTAIITLSNFMTIGALRAFARSRVACPDDVSIVGIDDLDWADIMSPRPTLIAQPIAEMTVKAVSILLEQVRIRNAPKRTAMVLRAKAHLARIRAAPYDASSRGMKNDDLENWRRLSEQRRANAKWRSPGLVVSRT